MTTSNLRTSTSVQPSTASTLTKRSGSRRLKAGSRSTATPLPPSTDCDDYLVTSTNYKRKIERHRWLIQQVESGLFLGLVRDGAITWVQHPIEALQHCQMEVACNNMFKLKEYYQVPEALRLEPVMFYSYPTAPTQWFTDYD